MTCTDQKTLDAMGSCLKYPKEGSYVNARIAAEGLQEHSAVAADAFAKLADWLAVTPPLEAEEVYTKLFDLRPACTLDIGHHVYGEAYQRGALLAGLVHEYRTLGVDMEDELPDFLPNVLRLVGRLPDSEERAIFLERILGVGVGKMKKALLDVTTPWAMAVKSLADVYVAPVEELDDSLHNRIRLEVVNNA